MSNCCKSCNWKVGTENDWGVQNGVTMVPCSLDIKPQWGEPSHEKRLQTFLPVIQNPKTIPQTCPKQRLIQQELIAVAFDEIRKFMKTLNIKSDISINYNPYEERFKQYTPIHVFKYSDSMHHNSQIWGNMQEFLQDGCNKNDGTQTYVARHN